MSDRPLEAECEDPQRPRPWAAAITIVLASLLTFGLPLAAPTLNAVGISGIPLGYYFAAQGALILVALLGLWLSGPWRTWPYRERLGAFLASLSATGSWLTAGLAMTIVGGLFVFGHDGLPLLLGLAAGLLVSLVFIAPALDRAGALHVDDLLARLTASRFAAAAAGLGMAAGLVMLMSIELEVVSLGLVASGVELAFGSDATIGLAAALALLLSFIPGRALRLLAIALAFIAVAAGIWFAIWSISGFAPQSVIPQLAYAEALSRLTGIERALLMEGLADPVSIPPFTRPFVQVSWLNFAMLTLSMLLGASVLPHMLWRRKSVAGSPGAANTTFGVGDYSPSRHKAAFGLVLAALLLSALPAAAILAKLKMYETVAAGVTRDAVPQWMRAASGAGYLRTCQEPSGSSEASGSAAVAPDCADPSGRLRISDLAINPAGVVLLIPGLAGTGEPWPKLFAAGVAFLALLAAAATLRMATESATGWMATRNQARAASGLASHAPLSARVLLALACAAVAAASVIGLHESPVNRLYWAFALLSASVFPMVLLVAVKPWINGLALALGGLTGLAVCLYYVIGTTGVFAPQFALLWQSVSDAPPWLLEELDGLMTACAAAGEGAEEACRGALDMGRELANWFGIDPRAGAAIAAPAGLLIALFADSVMPSSADHSSEGRPR